MLPCRNHIRTQSFGGEGKGGFILSQAKGGTQQASTSRTVPSSLGNRGRSYIQSSWSGVFDKDQGGNSPVLLSSAEFQKGGAADKIRGCLRVSGAWSPNPEELLWSL